MNELKNLEERFNKDDICPFDPDRDCPFKKESIGPEWCQVCAMMKVASTQRRANKLQNMKILLELKELLTKSLPYENVELEEEIKDRLIESAKELEGIDLSKDSTIENLR